MSGGPGVKVAMSVEDEDIIRSFDRQEQKVDANRRALQRMRREARDYGRDATGAAQKASSAFGSMVVKLASVSAIYSTIQKGIRAVVAENQRFSKSLDEVARRGSENELKLQIQSGFTPAQLESRLPQIKESLLKTPSTDVAGAFALSTQLVSSGFDEKDIKSGEALQTVLDLKAATNQFGEEVGDPKAAVKSIAQFLKGRGVNNPTAKQIRTTGAKLTQLFEGSDIQFQDLGDLAGQASVLTSRGLDESTQLAAFSAIRDVKDSPEAATGLRQVVSRLSTVGTSNAKLAALKKLGLTGDQVDLAGEDLPTVLKRLRDGGANVSKKEQAEIFNTLFGEKGEAAAQALIDKVDVIDKRIGLQKDTRAFDRNVKLFQRSRFASNQRAGIVEDFALRQIDQEQGGQTFAETRALSDAAFAQAKVGKTPGQKIGLSAIKAVGDTGLTIAESVGLSPDDIGIRRPGQLPGEARRALGPEVADLAQAILNAIIQGNKIAEENKRDPVRERGKANRKPPAAGNDRN